MLAIGLGAAFVAGLYARIRDVATPVESILVLIGGIAFTLCFTTALTIWTAPLMDMPSDQARALSAAEAYLGFDDVGWFLLGAGGVAAATMAVPASLAALRARLVPAWLGWLGIAAGLASLGTVIGFGRVAWMAWIAVTSVLLIAKR